MKTEFFQAFRLPIVIGNIPSSEILTRLSEYAVQIMKYHNPILANKKIKMKTHPKNPQLLYLIISTSPNINHPYVFFADMKTNILNMLIPFGIEQKQAPMKEIINIIPICSIMEKYALYLSILESIDLRKKAMLESDQYNLLKCSNISNCMRKFNEIKNMKISKNEKSELMKKYQKYYYEKAIKFLRIYFEYLTNNNYKEARDFLRGDSGQYFGRERLNTFFKNTKSLIGHLEIFIPLYEIGAILNSQI